MKEMFEGRVWGLSLLVGATAFGFAAWGCSAGSSSEFDDDGLRGDNGATSGADGIGGGFNPTGGSTGTGAATCNAGPDEDYDQDGYTINQGDCNDCDPNVNPSAIEVPTDPNDPAAIPADENCDGNIDEPLPVCDTGLALTDTNPLNGAAAIGVCQQVGADGKGFGIVSARYVRANGAPASAGLNVGVLDSFGPNVPPRQGGAMLALSSGHARAQNHPNPCNSLSCYTTGAGSAPPGFPQDVPGCGGDSEINDDIGLELQLRAPRNATGYSFDFTFYTFEYPEWVCSPFNDQFIALVNPAPPGSINGNISFDSHKNPVSVNIAFFDVCPGCALGTAELLGTGFGTWDDAGATGWLQTTAPIAGGETFTIRFAIWDTGDADWDSTVLIDNFKWLADPGTSVGIGTRPVPK